MHKFCTIALLGALVSVGTATGAEATNATALAQDWLVRCWQTRDGLPQDTVNAIVQTRDGYLWVGTGGGLARFDGVRFRTFGLQDGLRSVQISALLEDREGVLWVGTTGGGLSRWDHGRFLSVGEADDISKGEVQALAADKDGTLWVGTAQGLLRWRDGAFTKMGRAEGLPTKAVRALLLDSNGVLWVSILLEGLFRSSQGQFVRVPEGPPAVGGVWSLLEDREGCIWAGSGTGRLWEYRDGVWKCHFKSTGAPETTIPVLAQGDRGALWVGKRRSGLYVANESNPDNLVAISGLSEEAIRSLFVDRDGTVWVGTGSRGLCRVSRRLLNHWGKAEGLTELNVTSVAEDTSGCIWVGTRSGGIWRFQDNRFSQLTNPAVLKAYPYFYSTVAAEDGSVWAAGEQCLFRFRPDQPALAYLEPPVRGQAIDALCLDGPNLWLGTIYSALLKFNNGGFRLVATNGSFGGTITSMVRESSDNLWIGTVGGLYHWDHGQVRVWTTLDGLLTSSIRALHREPDGTLWLGTLGGGLARLKHGRIVNITTRQGLIDDIINQIVADDLGHMWLGCNRGIMRLERKELDDVAEGRASSLHPAVLGGDDGMLTEQCSGGHSPSALKTKDGRLFFPTVQGVVEVDPRRWHKATATMPQAAIEDILVDEQLQSLSSRVVLEPGKHRLELSYSVPSLREADEVRFRCRMEPLNKGWVEMGVRRRVSYLNLRPGQYVFHVTACDNQGAWNPNAASVGIWVKPRFWQTLWFQGLGVLAVSAAGIGGYRWRIDRLKRQRKAQEKVTRQIILSQENERKRVASELHDGLNQNLALLAVELEMFGQRAPTMPDGMQSQLLEFSQQAKSLSGEVHRISHGLHPAKLTQLGLTVALRGICREVEMAHGITVSFDAHDVPRVLPEDVALCLYRVAQEAIQNVVKHSGAKRAEVHLAVVDETLELTINDSGSGFETGEGRSGASLGLVSMQERVRLARGEIEIKSKPGHGTCIEARIPLPKETVI